MHVLSARLRRKTPTAHLKIWLEEHRSPDCGMRLTPDLHGEMHDLLLRCISPVRKVRCQTRFAVARSMFFQPNLQVRAVGVLSAAVVLTILHTSLERQI